MQEHYPNNRREFDEMFASEEACISYLGRLRWPEGFRCQKCASSTAWLLKRRIWECTECGTQRSPTEGTLLHRTRLSIKTWLDGAWHLCEQKNGMSALGLKRALGFGSYHTAWDMLHRMRLAMAHRCREPLSGTVEVDEAFIAVRHAPGGEAGSPDRALILIATEIGRSTIGRTRLKAIPDQESSTFLKTIAHVVKPGSTVVTDGLPTYAGLSSLNYTHVVARSGSDVGKALLPRTFRVHALLKRWFLGTLQGPVSRDRLQPYLDEFVFRFNRRNSDNRGYLFNELMKQAVAMEPVPKAAIQATPQPR